jgi:hypothetical protein
MMFENVTIDKIENGYIIEVSYKEKDDGYTWKKYYAKDLEELLEKAKQILINLK